MSKIDRRLARWIEDLDTAYGFQIFIKPYEQRQVNTEVFKIDESSGVMKDPKPVVIAGAQGTEFFGHNDQMDDTRGREPMPLHAAVRQ